MALSLAQAQIIELLDPSGVLLALLNDNAGTAITAANIAAAQVTKSQAITASGQTLTIAPGTTMQEYAPTQTWAAMTVVLPDSVGAVPDGFQLAIKNTTIFTIDTITWPSNVLDGATFAGSLTRYGSISVQWSETSMTWNTLASVTPIPYVAPMATLQAHIGAQYEFGIATDTAALMLFTGGGVTGGSIVEFVSDQDIALTSTTETITLSNLHNRYFITPDATVGATDTITFDLPTAGLFDGMEIEIVITTATYPLLTTNTITWVPGPGKTMGNAALAKTNLTTKNALRLVFVAETLTWWPSI